MTTLYDGLQSAYFCNERNGPRRDSYGNKDLSLVGGTIGHINGPYDNAILFPNSKTIYLTGGNVHYYPTFSVSCWIYGGGTGDQHLFGKYSSYAAGNGSWVWWRDGSNNINWFITHGGSYEQLGGGTLDASWTHCVGTWDDTTHVMNFYKGNVQKGPSTRTGTIQSDTTPFRISCANGTNAAQGRLWQILIWNRIITTAEVGILYNSGKGLPLRDRSFLYV